MDEWVLFSFIQTTELFQIFLVLFRTLVSEPFRKLGCDVERVPVKGLGSWASVFPACLLSSSQRSSKAALGVRRSIRKTGKQTNKRASWLGRGEVSSQSSHWFDLIKKRIFSSRIPFKRCRTQAHLSKPGSMLRSLGKCWTKPFPEQICICMAGCCHTHTAYGPCADVMRSG